MFLVKYQIIPNKIIKEFGGISFGDNTYLGVVEELDTNHTQITPDLVPADLLMQLKKSYYFYSKKELIFNPDGTVDLGEPTLDLFKAIKLDELTSATTSYIEKYYPDIKQKSDVSDKENAEAYLLSQGVDVVSLKIDIANETMANYPDYNAALTNIMAKYQSDVNPMINHWLEQGLKVAFRNYFVFLVKQEYYNFKTQIENALSEEELPNISEDLFPQYPKGV